MEVKACLSCPADIHGAIYMSTSPSEDFLHLVPIADILELHLLDRSPRDNHAVELFLTQLFKVAIKHHHVLYGRILRRVTFQLHETNLQLQRRVGKQTDQVCLCRYLQRHEIEDNHPQGTNVLHVSPGVVHHKDVLVLQQLDGGQFIW